LTSPSSTSLTIMDYLGEYPIIMMMKKDHMDTTIFVEGCVITSPGSVVLATPTSGLFMPQVGNDKRPRLVTGDLRPLIVAKRTLQGSNIPSRIKIGCEAIIALHREG
jgi:hypothetical protein